MSTTKTRKIDGFEYRQGAYGGYYADLETVLAHAKHLGYTELAASCDHKARPIDEYREMAKRRDGEFASYAKVYRLKIPRSRTRWPRAYIKTEYQDAQGISGTEIAKPDEKP